MKVNLLHSFGDYTIDRYEHELPEMQDNEMLVKTIYTGICRSDIDQYTGKIAIPFGHFGHESVGQIVKTGKLVTQFQEGDFVASRNDPAFSDYFYANEANTVLIPEASPKYIIEPVACSVNIAQAAVDNAENLNFLFIGSGYVSNIAAQYLKYINPSANIYVIGSHNVNEWNAINATFTSFKELNEQEKLFTNIIELSGNAENYEQISSVADVGAHICLAASFGKPISTNFWNPLWNNLTYRFPSPRTKHFIDCMQLSAQLIERNNLLVDWAWTHEYEVNNFKQAFNESVNRNSEKRFVRSYLKW